MNWLLLLKSKLTYVVILGIALLLSLMYINHLKNTIDVKDKELSVMNEKLGISQSSVELLKIEINRQNKALEQAKSDAEANRKAYEKDLSIARATAEKYKERARELLKRRPPPDVPVCKAADDLINEEIKNVKK